MRFVIVFTLLPSKDIDSEMGVDRWPLSLRNDSRGNARGWGWGWGGSRVPSLFTTRLNPNNPLNNRRSNRSTNLFGQGEIVDTIIVPLPIHTINTRKGASCNLYVSSIRYISN
jgi:hypothetical protein